jgi:hypothetical protein
MSLKDLKSPRVIHINYLMAEINGLTDDIYEDLMDYNIEKVGEAAQRLIDILTDIRETTGDVI